MMKNTILFCGYFGFANPGDEAVLAAEISTFRRHFPAREPVVISGNVDYTEQVHGVRAVPRYQPLHLIRELKKASFLVCGGGSLLQDVTSMRTVPFYLGIVRLALFFHVPVFFYGQGVGPLQRRISRYLVRKIGNQVQGITVRDENSLCLLKEIGITAPPLKLGADPVFSLQEAGLPKQSLFREKVASMFPENRPVVGLAPRLWEETRYLQPLAGELEKLKRDLGFNLLLLPFHLPGDLEACKLLQEAGLQGELWKDELNPLDIPGIISSLDLMVGVRLHALIFSCLAGVPLLGISYDPKVQDFLKMIGLDAASTVDRFSREQFGSCFRKLWAGRDREGQRLRKEADKLRERERVNIQLIEDYFRTNGENET